MPAIPPASRAIMKIAMCLLCFMALSYAHRVMGGLEVFPATPISKNSRKWRIGYYEGGPYINYPANLQAIAQGLAALGWMEKAAIPATANPVDSKVVWQTLAQSKSDYLEFVGQVYRSSNWDHSLRKSNREQTIALLQTKQIDFMIAMGTWAGLDLANNLHQVPVMVVSSSDPVKSGIVKSARTSGFDHVHARCDPYRYIRQVQLFHDIIGFKKLGVVYENTLTGKSYAALADIEQVAAGRGFQLVLCEAPWAGVPAAQSTQNLIECHKKLAPQIDALYLTVHTGVDLNRMDEILKPLLAYQIPTWSQRGPEEVRHGALMSIARADFESIGWYHATIMAKIFNGAKPGALNQIFEDPKRIAINQTTAKAIGFDVPKGLIQVADEIYQ
jgi:ABC-type uncharacterized transport system substrate-binding protein